MIRDGNLYLSEEDIVRLALQNNVDINVERYNPYFSLWGVDKSRAVLNPSFQFATNLDRVVTPTTSPLQGGETLLNLTTVYDLNFQKSFEPGFDIAVNFSTLRLRTSSFFNSLNPSLTSDLTISFSQHLLKDFGRISRGRHLRIARNNHGISQEDFVLRVTEIVTDVLNAYWDLVYSEKDIEVTEASLELAEVVLEQNKIQAEVGTMSPLDVVQAEAEVAGRRQQLVVAQHTKRITEDTLKKMISSELDPGLIAANLVPLSTPTLPPPPTGRVTEAIQRALEIRPEIKKLMLELDNKKIDVDYTRNQLKPSLDLVASYSQNGLGGVRILRDYSQGIFDAPVVGEQPGGIGDSLDSLFSRRYLGYGIGLSFQVPLGNDDARANNAQAQIAHKQTMERIRSMRQSVALEVRQAYDRMEMNRASVEAAEVTVRYEEERVRGEQDRYSQGATTTRFILEAQRDLQSARSILLQAQIDLIKSRIALEKAVGDTFAVRGIELQKALLPSK
jgi:outer membrane protein TolC